MDKQTFDAAVERLLREAETLIPEEALPDRPYQCGGDHGWYDFELKLWSKGEELRQLLLDSRRSLDPKQTDAVLSICREHKAKRGRQSFVLLLGRKGYACHAEAVAELLSDPNVAGQAIDTLHKMGVSGYQQQVEPFLSHKMAWIRNSAKRYLAKFQ